MALLLFLFLIILAAVAQSFIFAPTKFSRNNVAINSLFKSLDEDGSGGVQPRIPPNFEDMKVLATILANITDTLDTQPELALSIASQKMGWLYARDVPQLTQMMLSEFPSLRQDDGMMRAYMFLLDFLEAVVKETSTIVRKNQKNLRLIMEAAKVNEEAVNTCVASLIDDVKSPEFMLYLDSEIDMQEKNSPMENLLTTIKLRVLDEIGKT